MLETLFGALWEDPTLSIRERRLLVIGVLAAQGEEGTLALQLRCALKRGELTRGAAAAAGDVPYAVRRLPTRLAALQGLQRRRQHAGALIQAQFGGGPSLTRTSSCGRNQRRNASCTAGPSRPT